MSNTTRGSLPLEVGALGNLEARMVRNFRAAIEDWDEVCSALGTWEAQHLTDESNALAKEQHRRWVTELLSWGELVRRVTGQPQFPDKAVAARVEHRLRHLEDKLALWHRQLAPDEQERILKAAFR